MAKCTCAQKTTTRRQISSAETDVVVINKPSREHGKSHQTFLEGTLLENFKKADRTVYNNQNASLWVGHFSVVSLGFI